MASFCTKCGSPIKADDCFCPECGNKLNTVETPAVTPNPEPAPSATKQESTDIPSLPPNHLVKSILLTCLLFWPLGIPAIVNASKVDNLYYAGKYKEAYEASERANTWCNRCILWGIIYIVLIFFLYFFLIILSVILETL